MCENKEHQNARVKNCGLQIDECVIFRLVMEFLERGGGAKTRNKFNFRSQCTGTLLIH